MTQPLPIDPLLPKITAELETAPSVVLQSPPGTGKSTRLPPALLQSAFLRGGKVLVLEPRRLAARLAAQRVAQEQNERVGERIGYQVRLESRCSAQTQVIYLTEGVLSRRLLSDPTLQSVSAVVLDEFHERHLQGDLALALIKRLQSGSRPDLRLVVMSATLETSPIASFLDNCPIINLEGKRFEVQIDYLPQPDERPLASQILSSLRTLLREGLKGDVLVFLPGASEIRAAMKACEPLSSSDDLMLVALHGDLPTSEQDRALARASRRKVIFSTNVAETSVTIEGVEAVIDSGLARIAGHAPWSGLPTLKVLPISRASATQRAGRAGRTGPGRCLRLYTRADFDRRPEYEQPEIRRLDLTELLLMLKALGVPQAEKLDWFESPPASSLEAAHRLLDWLGAVKSDGELSAVGKELLRFPVHPRIGRILLEAERRGLAEQGALLAALLSEKEILLSRRAYSFGARSELVESAPPGLSDLLTSAELWEKAWQEDFAPGPLRALGIDKTGALLVDKLQSHLQKLLQNKAPRPKDPETEARVCILTGYADRVARRSRENSLALVGGGLAQLSPSSEVKYAEFLVALEAEERNEGRGRKLLVRTASAIEPEWLLEFYPERIHESVEARWNPELERVETVERLEYETLTLDETRGTQSGQSQAAKVLAEAAFAKGIDAFAPKDALERWLGRVRFAAEHGTIPNLDEAAVRKTLGELCEQCRSFAELRQAGLLTALEAKLTSAQRRLLDTLAPEKVTLPGGRALVIHYEPGKAPWAASRLQDFFGMAQGPAVAQGKVPLTLHLLAPNQRAVQVTSDLAGFWQRTYPGVRKELCRKYPKHAWPEDGRTASPPAPGRLRSGG